MIRVAVLDDDQVFADTLARRLTRKGLNVEVFYQILPLLHCQTPFDVLLLDMNLGGHSSIAYLAKLREKWPSSQILMLTGYASIASTVAAIKSGADDYLTKPVDMAVLLEKLLSVGDPKDSMQDQDTKVLTPAQLEWEHIQRVLQENHGNISAAARALNMHRRTLQRKLQKKPTWEI